MFPNVNLNISRPQACARKPSSSKDCKNIAQVLFPDQDIAAHFLFSAARKRNVFS